MQEHVEHVSMDYMCDNSTPGRLSVIFTRKTSFVTSYLASCTLSLF